jgi:hypothetical protein
VCALTCTFARRAQSFHSCSCLSLGSGTKSSRCGGGALRRGGIAANALHRRVCQVLMMQPMYNYPLFVNLLTTFAYLPTSFAYIYFMVW